MRLGVANWYTAPVIARLLIASEFILGLLLILQLFLKRFTLKATLALLTFFSLYLIFELFTEGNSGNCGCFGTYLEMTPLESLLKNFMMIGIVCWLLITHHNIEYPFMKHPLIARGAMLLFFSVSIAPPFILNPPEFIIKEQYDKNRVNYVLDLSKVYDNETMRPDVDLRKGKHILSLMSLRCPHCKIAAFKMAVMHNRHPKIPFFNFYRGKTEEYLQPFFNETHAAQIPYFVYNTDDFNKLSGGALPAIYWLKNDTVVRTSTYLDLNETEIVNWLTAP